MTNYFEFYEAFKALRALKPASQWTRADMLKLGYSPVDCDQFEKTERRDDFNPYLLMDDKLRANKKYAWHADCEFLSLQKTFPLIWSYYSNGEALPDAKGGYDALYPLLRRFDKDYHYGPDEKSWWWCYYKEMTRQSRPMWQPLTWDMAFYSILEQLDKEAEANKPPAKAGRKPTELTARITLIREVIGVSERRAYAIDRDGTDNLADRIVLAEAFARIFDVERDTAARWELSAGRKHGRLSARRTFADYVLSFEDAFDSDLTAQLETLRNLYDQGELPRSFKDFLTFSDALAQHGIEIGSARKLWDRAASWCKVG